MFHDVCDVITSEFVAIRLYIRDTGDFKIRFRLGKTRSKYFVIISTVN